MEPLSAPGEGQTFLTKFVGTWGVEKTFHPKAGEPVKMTGECVQEMTHGGRFLRSEFTFGEKADRTTGTGVIGYEPDTKLFTSTWYDSRSTRLSLRRSKTEFDGKEIVLHGASLSGEAARASKTVTRLEGDGERIVHTQYASTDDGKERVVMELVMTKSNSAKEPPSRKE